MSLLRQNAAQELVIDRPSDEVFRAFQGAGNQLGKVKDALPPMGTMVIRASAGGLSNPATVRISVEAIASSKTRVRFQSDSLDGAVGFGSAGKVIDAIVRRANGMLFPEYAAPPEKDHLKPLLIVACVVAVVIAFALLSIS